MKVAGPLIAVSCQYDLEKKRSFVYRDYFHSVQNSGGVPYLIPILVNPEHVKKALEPARGLLLVGSDDIHPRRYGAEKIHPETKLEAPEKTETDFALVETALERNLPVLGVCGGMQLLAVYFGGTLNQHIPDFSDLCHKSGDSKNPAFHSVKITDKKMAEGFGADKIEVNSYHHQAIDCLPDNLRPAGTADDGVVEAFRVTDLDFGIAVQWHPEKISDRPEHKFLFDELVSRADES